MTAEQIEQAIHRGWIEHHIGNQVQTDEDVDRFYPLPSENFREGFIAGAEWRINSVWHGAEITPKENSKIVLIDKDGYWYNLSYSFDEYDDAFWKSWVSCVIAYEIDKWAYINDLLPRKEDAE